MTHRPCLATARSLECALRFVLTAVSCAAMARAAPASYAIVSSAATAADPGWREVRDALREKHPAAQTLAWQKNPSEVLAQLSRQHPRYVCWLCQPAEVSVAFVKEIHQLTRNFDDDPYTDCQWAVLTGFDAPNALAIARETKPLVIHHVLAGTEIAVDRCRSAEWFSELEPGRHVRKPAAGKPVDELGPVDSAFAIAKALEDPQTGLFVTSGHATQHAWQIGFNYRNGHWTSRRGGLFAVDLAANKHPVTSPHPKVWLPVGNCLIGHIDGPDAMALAFMQSAGVRQMAGYTLPTWYGYQGWGLLDYFLEQPGRYTLTEAFFANQAALVHRLLTNFPNLNHTARPNKKAAAAGLTAQDARGLVFDRDAVVFYGDPAWRATMAPGKLNWQQEWQQTATGGSLLITPLAGPDTFKPVHTNGSQRGGRPVVQFFQHRLDPASVVITQGAELNPVITDDFLLVPLPPPGSPPKPFTVAFTALTK